MVRHFYANLLRITAVLALAAALSSCEESSTSEPQTGKPPVVPANTALTGKTPDITTAAAPAAAPSPSPLTPEQAAREAQLKQAYSKLGAGLAGIEQPMGPSPAVIRVRLSKPPALEHEQFYHSVLTATAGAFRRQPFRLVDEEQGTVVESGGGPNETLLQDAVINGTADFFQAESLKHYKYVKPLPSPAPNQLLQTLIRSGWSDSAVEETLGTPDSHYNGSDLFFKKRIWVTGRERLTRLLIQPEYPGSVVGAVGTRSTRSEIETALGEPHFESPEDHTFGYKLDPFYLFFSGEADPYEIAVYPRNTAGRQPSLPDLIRELQKDNRMNPDELVERLRETWTDYDHYYIGRGSHQIAYYAAGVRIPYIDSPEPGPYIEIYGNYEGPLTDGVSLPDSGSRLSGLTGGFFRFRLHEDLAFEQEKQRVRQNRTIAERAAAEGIPSHDGTQLVLSNEGYVFEQSGFFLLRPGGDRPPVERRTGHFASRYTWLNDRYFLYEVAFRGILAYDTQLECEIPIAGEGDYKDEYRLVRIDASRSVIVYTQGDQELEKSYTMDPEGKLVFP